VQGGQSHNSTVSYFKQQYSTSLRVAFILDGSLALLLRFDLIE